MRLSYTGFLSVLLVSICISHATIEEKVQTSTEIKKAQTNANEKAKGPVDLQAGSMLGPLPAAAASIAAGGAANSLGVLSQVGGIGSTLGPMAALGMGMGMGPMGMGGMGMRGWMPGTPVTDIDGDGVPDFTTDHPSIQALTPLTADPIQYSENESNMITRYQANLKMMYAQVTQQTQMLHKADELIFKLMHLQELNREILVKNRLTVKMYSDELVALVTKYALDLNMDASGAAGAGSFGATTATVAKFREKLKDLKERVHNEEGEENHKTSTAQQAMSETQLKASSQNEGTDDKPTGPESNAAESSSKQTA